MRIDPTPVFTRETARRLTVVTYQPEDFLAELASLLAEAAEANRRAEGALTAAREDVLCSRRTCGEPVARWDRRKGAGGLTAFRPLMLSSYPVV